MVVGESKSCKCGWGDNRKCVCRKLALPVLCQEIGCVFTNDVFIKEAPKTRKTDLLKV
jgi:hypothetical protein